MRDVFERVKNMIQGGDDCVVPGVGTEAAMDQPIR